MNGANERHVLVQGLSCHVCGYQFMATGRGWDARPQTDAAPFWIGMVWRRANRTAAWITIVITTGGKPIFWTGGLEPTAPVGLETITTNATETGQLLVQRKTGEFIGQGDFNLDFAVYALLGVDLSKISKSTLEALRLPARVLLPFMVFLLAGSVTPRQRKEMLDRYFAKMSTEVAPDPREDRARLERAYAEPEFRTPQRLFPQSDWEFNRPRGSDVAGFVVSVGVCGAIIGLLVGLAAIGSH